MYTFAIVALLGLATVKLVDFLCDTVPGLANLRSILTFVCAIGAALARLKVKPGAVVMGVPRNKAVLRTLLLPVIDKLPELASMVHFQVGRDLPFRLEEAVLDFKVGRRIEAAPEAAPAEPKPDGGAVPAQVAPRLEVLVAAVKREVVEHYQAVARAAGCTLAALGLLPFANARCVEACRVAEEEFHEFNRRLLERYFATRHQVEPGRHALLQDVLEGVREC